MKMFNFDQNELENNNHSFITYSRFSFYLCTRNWKQQWWSTGQQNYSNVYISMVCNCTSFLINNQAYEKGTLAISIYEAKFIHGTREWIIDYWSSYDNKIHACAWKNTNTWRMTPEMDIVVHHWLDINMFM